jgi:hypothetical protein
MMRMGDDDGGGWGGGGGDDDAGGDDDDDESEEGGKKKKKKGFFGTIIGKLVSCAVVVALVSCLICLVGIGYMTGLIKPSPAFAGEWNSTSKVKINVIGEDDKEVEEEVIEAKLEIKGTGDEGTGNYTPASEDMISFVWKNHDKDKKTVVLEFDAPGAKDKTFWRELKSPTTFEYKVEGGVLTLTPSGGDAAKAISFNKVEKAAPPPAAKKKKRR